VSSLVVRETGLDEKVRLGLLGAYILGLGVSITLAEAALVGLVLRWVWRLARGEARKGWPLAWPLVAFAGATVLAALLSDWPGDSLFSARKVLLLGGLWVVHDALPDARAAARALTALLAVLGVVGAVGVLQVTFCAELGVWAPVLGRVAKRCDRAHAFYSIYMTFAGVLDVVLLAALPELLRARGRPRWMSGAWLVALVALALTYVRGAWLGLAAGVTALAAALPRRRRVLFGAIVVLAVGLLLLPGVRERVRSIADPTDPTSSERWLMWRSGVQMALDHPLFGIGPGQVRRVYPEYAAPEVANKHRGHLHSSPMQILVERGILGLAAWLWVFAAFFVRARHVGRRVAGDARASALVAGAVAATAGFLVSGLFEHNFGDTEVLLAATFVMSFALVVDPEREG
jgi:putative inorganic carbon (HCO3(-)) transporter